MIGETPLLIQGPCGDLEALLCELPQAHAVALLCHPNPEQGGTMLNKVVSTLQRAARDQGLHTLRFNFRGTGNSAGSHSMGDGEVDDAEAVVEWLAQRYPSLPVVLMGFSFGGFVAAAVSGRLRAKGQSAVKGVLVAPAVQRLSATQPVDEHLDWLIVVPEQDEVIAPQWVYDWAHALSSPHQLVKVAECGHFFHGRLPELKALVQSFLDDE